MTIREEDMAEFRVLHLSQKVLLLRDVKVGLPTHVICDIHNILPEYIPEVVAQKDDIRGLFTSCIYRQGMRMPRKIGIPYPEMNNILYVWCLKQANRDISTETLVEKAKKILVLTNEDGVYRLPELMFEANDEWLQTFRGRLDRGNLSDSENEAESESEPEFYVRIAFDLLFCWCCRDSLPNEWLLFIHLNLG